MPIPTALHSFGESSSSSIFNVLELDTQANLDVFGEEVTSFPPGTLVYFLLQIESGVKIDHMKTSYGDIVNPNSRKIVTRSFTTQLLQFPNSDSSNTIAHIPFGNISVNWQGLESKIIRNGRVLTCENSPRLATVTYKYQSYQFQLMTDKFVLTDDEDFNILIDVDLSI